MQGGEVGATLGWARLAVLAGALALTGCVTTENTLSPGDVANMKLAGVTVGFAPDAFVQWEDGFRAYATAKSIPDDQIAAATNTPECKEYVKNLLAPKLTRQFGNRENSAPTFLLTGAAFAIPTSVNLHSTK